MSLGSDDSGIRGREFEIALNFGQDKKKLCLSCTCVTNHSFYISFNSPKSGACGDISFHDIPSLAIIFIIR